MKSKMAILASALVRKLWRLRSSHSSVAKHLPWPRCQGEEIVRDLGGGDVETQMLFFDGVLLDVLWGIDGTKEIAMQVEASLRQARRDRDALDGSCVPVVWPQ